MDKSLVRQQYRGIRNALSITRSQEASSNVLNSMLDTHLLDGCDCLYTYVARSSEINTTPIINKALDIGVRVAVPVSITGSHMLDFYEIDNLDDLVLGTYNVLEPNISTSKMVSSTGTSHSICLVPGLVFDSLGNRLGYGCGYYDRFLSNFIGKTMGLTYKETCVKSLSILGALDEYDVAVDSVIVG